MGKFFVWSMFHTEEEWVSTNLDEFPTLEEAWKRYNQIAAESHTLEVRLLTPIKEFKR